MLKKIISFFICIVIILAPMATASSQWPVNIYCNGSLLASDTPPEIIDAHTFVPIGAIATAMGINAIWDDEWKHLSLQKNEVSLDMYIGSSYMEHDGVPFTCDMAPYISNDRVMVPLRLLSEILGYEVMWDSLTMTVNISQPKKIYYDISKDYIDIYGKYSSTQDIMFRFERRGPNSIPDFSQIYLIYNTDTCIKTGIDDGFLFYSNVTDWHSPFIITADENADGDSQDELHFTGGYHGYYNTQYGSQTASMKYMSYHCDDTEPHLLSGLCNKFEIMWTNAVQASNTKLEDGTGREVMEEEHSLVFDGNIWYSDVTLRPLENITVHKLYGFQADIAGTWDDYIEYSNSHFNLMLPTLMENSSGEASTCTVTCTKDRNALTMTLDTAFGLGTREYCENADGIFMSSYKKVYFNLVNGVPLKATPESEYSYRGTYCFYSF